MNAIIQSGNIFSFADIDSANEKLPLGVYTVAFSDLKGFFLQKSNPLTLPEKIYGDMSIVQRAIDVYQRKEGNFGLLLSGLKGAGKTLTMRKLAIDLNQPVIILNDAFVKYQVELIKFLSDPRLGDVTILIDEFEKIFENDDATPLSLLDGLFNCHNFYILTCNKAYVNENLINRPGRIYYHKNYEGLDEPIIEEVINDMLINKSNKEELIMELDSIPNLSFDMLISIINDLNQFGDTPKKTISYFGFEKEGILFTSYQIVNGHAIQRDQNISFTPEEDELLWLEYRYISDDGKEISDTCRIKIANLVKIAPRRYKVSTTDGTFNKQVVTFELEIQRKRIYNYIL